MSRQLCLQRLPVVVLQLPSMAERANVTKGGLYLDTILKFRNLRRYIDICVFEMNAMSFICTCKASVLFIYISFSNVKEFLLSLC